ncbi:MAG: aminotransferase class V-fold PLP-dependent enzyme [Firmicutes bacterium]|nr:aminotransferase class V-fold PLP-dependent enzyme [Bacillota bacterium]
MSDTIYFDNAATTFPKPEEVYVFMDKFYRECGVNLGRGQHNLAAKASALVSETRRLLLDLFHCSNKKVIFTHTATEAMNIILQGLTLTDGCNIYLSPFEHNAVTRIVAHLQDIHKLNVITLAVNKEKLSFDLERIRYQFSEKKPALVVLSHASNVCGVVAPIHELCAMSKPYGAINVIDMCQTAGLVDTDVSSDNIDFAIFAGHKTLYGPLGVAGFVCSGRLKPLPLLFGGTGADSANQSLPETVPERYEVASPNIHAISGLFAALQWIKATGIEQIYEKEKYNHFKLIDVLSCFDNIKIFTPNDISSGIGVVSCVFNGYSSDSIGKILSEHHIAVRTGLHCAPYCHKFLGTYPAGTVRFSVSYFNTDADFTVLHRVLDYIVENS